MRPCWQIFPVVILLLFGRLAPAVAEEPVPRSERPFFEYKGNYGEEIGALKGKFREAFGYELVDLGRQWAPDEIRTLHAAFEQLPVTLYRLPVLKALYRLENLVQDSPENSTEDVPAATLPSFTTLYDAASKSYKVLVENQDLRVEFYNPLFYEDRADLFNIVHHEMAHAFDFANGFISFSDEWLSLTKFHALHIFALDGNQDSDSLYALVNDPAVDNYAPVATRHLSTYSRQNPQEDFANSVTAYIHYPYFRYTHPARYRFLQQRVFGGREYFASAGDSAAAGFEGRVMADLEQALAAGGWNEVRAVLVELSRGYYPGLEAKVTRRIREALGTVAVSPEKDLVLARALCFLMHPEALEVRRNLIRARRVTVQTFLKDERCFRVARDPFENDLVKWPPSNLYFYRENDRDTLQFMDPVLATAHSRGFDTDYFWRIVTEGGPDTPLAEGRMALREGGNGSVRIDLTQTALKPFALPGDQVYRLELGARRLHPQNFKIFESRIATIRFVVQPWFRYWGPRPPGIRVIYPFRPSFKDFN